MTLEGKMGLRTWWGKGYFVVGRFDEDPCFVHGTDHQNTYSDAPSPEVSNGETEADSLARSEG